MKASIDKASEHASMTHHKTYTPAKKTQTNSTSPPPPAAPRPRRPRFRSRSHPTRRRARRAPSSRRLEIRDLCAESKVPPLPLPLFPPASSKHPCGGNRAELAKKKQEYANQLASFERERISVLSEEFSSSITPPRKPVKKTQTGLESVTITSEDAGGELEDFFGGGESSGVSSQPDTVVQKKEKGKTKTAGRRAEVSVRVRRPAKANPHLGVMEDEDIEEGRKWY